MAWLIRPSRLKNEYDRSEEVISGVRCVVKVVDGDIVVEAAARSERDIALLKKILNDNLSMLLSKLRRR